MININDILVEIKSRGLNINSLLTKVRIEIEPNRKQVYNGRYIHNTPSKIPLIILRNRSSKWEHRNVVKLMADTLLHEFGHHYHHTVMPNCTKNWNKETMERFADDFRDNLVYEYFKNN